MGLETFAFIDSMNASNPVGSTDTKSQGDDHIRGIKTAILATFPNITGAVSLTHTQINAAAIKTAANSFTNDQTIADGSSLIIADSTNADTASISHDGTDLNVAMVNSTDVNISGLTGALKVISGADFIGLGISSGDAAIYTGSVANLVIDASAALSGQIQLNNNSRVMSGKYLRISDAGNTDFLQLAHDGTDANVSFSGTTDLNVLGGVGVKIHDSTDTDFIRIQHNGTDVNISFGGTTDVNIEDGVILKLESASGGQLLAIEHNGTDAVLTGTNTTNLNIVGMGLDTGTASLTTANDTADEPGFKGLPVNTQNGSYSLVLSDAGKMVRKASGGSGETITIPANGSVAFPIGTVIEIVNDGGGTLSIAITTDTLEQYGGSTGTRTLADNGKAIIEKVTSTLWKISGIGLS